MKMARPQQIYLPTIPKNQQFHIFGITSA